MRCTIASALLSLTLAAGAVRAQAIRIGYVDVQRAIQEVEEGKAAKAKLKSEFDTRKAALDKKQAELEKMQQDYEKQAPVLSDDAKKKKQEEFQKALFEARKSASELQEDLATKEQQATGGIFQRIQQVVAEIAERDGLTFVLDRATMLYAPAASDLTNEVVRRYNDRFAVAKAPAKPAEKKATGPVPAGKPAPAPAPAQPAGKK